MRSTAPATLAERHERIVEVLSGGDRAEVEEAVRCHFDEVRARLTH